MVVNRLPAFNKSWAFSDDFANPLKAPSPDMSGAGNCQVLAITKKCLAGHKVSGDDDEFP